MNFTRTFEACMNEDETLHGDIVDDPLDGIGHDKTPSAEMIAAGKVGMGSWSLTDGSVQQKMAERYERVKEAKDEREKFFHERAKDGIADAIDLNHRIVKRGQLVMDKLEKGDPEDRVTGNDMQVLKMAQTAAKELTDRAVGKAKQRSESEALSTSFEFLINTDEGNS